MIAASLMNKTNMLQENLKGRIEIFKGPSNFLKGDEKCSY